MVNILVPDDERRHCFSQTCKFLNEPFSLLIITLLRISDEPAHDAKYRPL